MGSQDPAEPLDDDGLTVESAAVIRVRLPLHHPVAMAGRTFSVADNVLVRVGGGGLTGWGESTSAIPTTGEAPAAIATVLRDLLGTALAHGPVRLGALRDAARVALAATPAARSALDVALLDLAARARGIGVAALLGAAPSSAMTFPVSALLGGATVADDVAAARALVDTGVRRLKLKVGRRPVAEEIEAVRAIATQLGEGSLLGADANEGLDLGTAATLLAGVGGALAFLEQPLGRHDLAGPATLRNARTGTAIVADEAVGGVADVARLAAAGAIDGVMLKLQKAGSLGELVAAARSARGRGLGVGLTGKVAETGIASAALVHAAALADGADYGISLTNGYLAVDPVAPRLEVAAGFVTLPAGPGLGVAIDEDALAPWVVDAAIAD